MTDLLCVVQKRVVPSYASQVSRALMRVLRRWPHEFGFQRFAALKIWAGVATWAPEFLSALQGHLADELATIAHELSIRAASARVRRWRKWAQSVVSD